MQKINPKITTEYNLIKIINTLFHEKGTDWWVFYFVFLPVIFGACVVFWFLN
jgi:hypothetical protein